MTEVTNHKSIFRVCMLVMLLSVSSFLLIAWQVFHVGNLSFDRDVALLASNFNSSSITSLMEWITFFGSSLFLLPAYLILACICIFSSRRIEGLMVACTGFGGYLFIAALKVLFERTRPVDSLIHPPTTFSFPSGHSGSGMIFYLLLAFMLTRQPMEKYIRILVF